jgi:hypothetical protein
MILAFLNVLCPKVVFITRNSKKPAGARSVKGVRLSSAVQPFLRGSFVFVSSVKMCGTNLYQICYLKFFHSKHNTFHKHCFCLYDVFRLCTPAVVRQTLHNHKMKHTCWDEGLHFTVKIYKIYLNMCLPFYDVVTSSCWLPAHAARTCFRDNKEGMWKVSCLLWQKLK